MMAANPLMSLVTSATAIEKEAVMTVSNPSRTARTTRPAQ